MKQDSGCSEVTKPNHLLGSEELHQFGKQIVQMTWRRLTDHGLQPIRTQDTAFKIAQKDQKNPERQLIDITKEN